MQDLSRKEPQLQWVAAAFKALAEKSDGTSLSALVRTPVHWLYVVMVQPGRVGRCLAAAPCL